MDFVGKSITKEFEGFGVFRGVIDSFDSATGFYRIMYEDGDSEEIDSAQVSKLISNSLHVGPVTAGRKPKCRPNNGPLHDPGKIDVNLHENLMVESQLGRNLDVNADANGNCNVNGNVNVDGNGKLNGGLDLNRGFESDEGVVDGGKVGGIDLNVSVEDADVNENGVIDGKVGSLGGVGEEEVKKERGFDLNLGFDDEGVNGGSGSVDAEVCVSLGEELRNKDVGEVDCNNVESGASDGQLEESGSEVLTPILREDATSGRRKRRKVEKHLSSPAKTILRRSARRANAAAVAEIKASSTMVEDGVNDVSVSGLTEEFEEKPVAQDIEMAVEPEVPPSKLDLPPSSANLNLEGIPVEDLFSVYSCLRSLSTLLYLSPFELEDFVAALKSRVFSPLIDFIHVSILQTLRKHLEFLANEGCESASTCLRNLNWDLLDEITWPVFMVEYFLIHSSSLKPGFSLNQFKQFDVGYYKQPENVKIELLRCLCDDVVEVEAIRSELTRRRIMTEGNTDVDRTISSDPCGKRRILSDASGDFHLGEDVEEVADGNSDECCLCKMDGNLICCDGCPAAFHSKCTGIVSSLLPEGDWYCPECAISRHSFASKPRKLFRGAELLGIDPFDRLFFSCFDYLLVSESNDANASFCYYHKDDLNTVVQLLQSSSITYGSILRAIFQNLAVPTISGQLERDMKSDNCMLKDEDSIGRKTKSFIVGHSIDLGSESSKPTDFFGVENLNHCTATENLATSCKEPDEVVLQANEVLQNSHRPMSNRIAKRTLAKRLSVAETKKKHPLGLESKSSNTKLKEEDRLQEQSGYSYINNYKFGRTAASVVEELLRKPSDKASINIPKTEEQIISIQLKFITKKSTKFCWPTIQQLNEERQKEKCGWCYCCRFSVEDRDCLFNINCSSIPESLKKDTNDILSKRNDKGHLVDIVCYILCMEERLRGLLLGPWLSPQYSELWRKNVLQASDVSALKHPLLMLESNINPSALSADWSKHIDSVGTMGSASHFVANSRVNSKNGISKKKGKYADSETKSSAAGNGLSLFWWRGGRTSRSLFNWKVIPRSAALKAARKAGYAKIPDVLYTESLKNTKRSKYVAWRAAVEASGSIEQLALQVRELDMFIRWDEIENTQPHCLLDKETIKSIRLFKKVTVRRKCVEGTAKYLLDFGKRRSIPEVVTKHGQKLEDSEGERKKYWLNESYVPLYLIKNFEERRIVRKATKSKSNVVSKGGKKTRKLSNEKGFAYLFLKAEMTEKYLCGHCNKNILTSEAVSCEHCNGFFHKRHVMKSSEETAECTYTCPRCRTGKQGKNDNSRGKKKFGKLLHGKKLKVGRKAMPKTKLKKGGKTLHRYPRMSLRNIKKVDYHEQQNEDILDDIHRPLPVKNTDASADVTLRRSSRATKCSTPEPVVLVGARKRKRNKNINGGALKKTPQNSSQKKRRTHVLHSFWINGLRLSRKPKDERVTNFKRKRLCVAFESSDGISDQTKCSLCLEQEFKPTLVYVACDICEVWFHGEAFGVNRRNIKNLIGFKCHICRETSAPICPFAGN
ncbi:DDT domain-containing protein PTM [Silene latifolia]|uniref:DDT domain-containing protein PTM n=1 Tax=Silene latifolia TaxID=37657 RepID=UPI003D7790A4